MSAQYVAETHEMYGTVRPIVRDRKRKRWASFIQGTDVDEIALSLNGDDRLSELYIWRSVLTDRVIQNPN